MMISDPWTFKRDWDEARYRLVLAYAGWLFPDAQVETEDGALVFSLKAPPADILGIIKGQMADRVRARCVEWLPRMCGWCPEVRIEWTT